MTECAIVNECGAVEYLRSRGYDLQQQTLRAWRHRGKGPAYIKPKDTGKIRYRIADLDQFLDAGRIVPAALRKDLKRAVAEARA